MIQREGPFDAVMGFSQVGESRSALFPLLPNRIPQGAALAASATLRHQIQNPSEPPLFRIAIFICSPIPFSQSLDVGIDARKYFGLRDIQRPSRPGCSTDVPEYLITDPAYLKSENNSDDSSSSDDDSQPALQLSRGIYYQMYHSSVDSVRINIPTVHVYGRQDKWRLHSKDLVKLCASDLTTVFEHDGGHEIPKLASEEICDAIEIAAATVWH